MSLPDPLLLKSLRRREAFLAGGKLVLLTVLMLALLEPFIYNIILYSSWHSGFIAESSIFSLDRHKYFSGLFHAKSLFFAGQYSVFVSNYFIWYALWSAISTLFPDITSYFILIIGFYLLGFYFFVKLALSLTGTRLRDASLAEISIIGAMGLLYFSSLSMFNYLKSNVFFVLPYLILPVLLYTSSRFLRSNDKRYLFPYLFLSLLLADLNVTHALILVGFLNVFLFLQARSDGLEFSHLLKRIAALDTLLLPAFCFLLIMVTADVSYSGGLSAFTKVATENMYSNNASYTNIFSQLTDWGLFGSWNGIRYYAFSQFYANNGLRIAAFAPYVLLAYALIVTRVSGQRKALAASLLVVLVVIFQLMLGNNNILYHYLYAHMVIFQVFRNVTKLAPLLYLVLLLATYILLSDRISEKLHCGVACVLLVAALAYNIPYWSYQAYFFHDRAIKGIPSYWRDAAAYINKNVDQESSILALPAIYINDIYLWDGKQAWVQGSLLDILVRNRSYRLSECCIGPPQFQYDARNVFVPSTRSIRHLDTDYRRLSALVRKYHLDYVVVSSDLLSEYQDIGDIRRWLYRSGYSRVAVFGKVSIFRNKRLSALPFAGEYLSFQRLSNLSYRVRLGRLKASQSIYLREPFDKRWTLYLEPWSDASWCRHSKATAEGTGVTLCKSARSSFGFDELARISQRPDTSLTHKADDAGFNEWVLDEGDIKRHYSKEFYRDNPDGSLAVQLELYFRPQAYFLMLTLAGTVLFAVMFMCVATSFAMDLRKKKRHKMAEQVTGR